MARTGSILGVGLTFALACAVVTALSACGSGVGTPTPTPTPSPTYDVTGDGVLRIGTLFPTSGEVAFIGPAQVAGVEAAIRDINEAGGINGVPVEVYHRNSADASTETAQASFADLVTKGVDVVIGPASSSIAERVLPLALDANVPLISPAATMPWLTDADDSGLLFRTIASYELQGAVLADELGASKVAYLYLDDELGSSLSASLESALSDAGGEVVLDEGFTQKTTDFSRIVRKVKKAKPEAVVLGTPAFAVEQTKALITALTDAGYGGEKLWLTSENLADYSQALPAGTLNKVNGLLIGAVPDEAFIAKLKQADPSVRSFQYAAEAYDATVLAVLSALIGGDDGGAAVARNLGLASSGGIKCTSYGECIDVLSTEPDIDFDGISGPVNFTKAGDVAQGSIRIYAYAEGNTATLVRVVVNG